MVDCPPRPEPLPILFDNIPGELRYLNHWLLWRYEWKEGKDGKPGKWDKPPMQPNGNFASSTARLTWSPFQVVKEAYERGLSLPVDDSLHFDGVGFVPAKMSQAENILQFGDLDKCRDKETGQLSPEAKADLDLIKSYCEISPSGTGIRFIAKGAPHYPAGKDGGKNGGIELYQARHYLTITGHRLEEYPATIETRTGELNEFYNQHFGAAEDESDQPKESPQPTKLTDDQIICLASEAANAKKFMALMDGDISGYKSHSEADQALCNILAFYTTSEGQIDSIFRRSGLYREKWVREDYRESTIQNAISFTVEHYGGQAEQEPAGGDPSIRPVSVEDKAGHVGIGPKGTVCKVVELTHPKSGEIKKFLGWVSDCALHIETETRSKDETEFIFVGTGATDKRSVRFTLPAGSLAEPKRFKAALLNAFGAKNRIGELNFEMVQGMSLNPRLMQRVEVPAWDGNIPLLPGVNLAGNVEYRLSPKIPASVYDGGLQAAGDVLKKLLNVHRFAPLVVAAVMGAPAVARWHRGDRFGLGLWGQTGTLKTSMVLAAMGIYGIGYLDAPRLKAGKGGATLVAAMEIFAAAGFLPQLYDNVKNVDAKDSQSYIAAMHAVLEGEEKARGKKDGGLRESREFLCTPIVTGEVRPQEASTSARVLNLNWSQPNANLLTEVQKNAALLPVVGYHWLRFLAETDCVLGKDFEAFRSKKMGEFLELKYVNPGRLATIHALMRGTWQLLEASPMGEVFTEDHERFKTALDAATAAQGQAVAEETEIERFLSGLEELLASNPGLIQSKDGKKTIAGSIIGKEMELGLFLLPAETLNELMKIKAFNQQPTTDSITQALNERGLLVPGESGKLQNRQRINGTRVYGWYIRVSPSKEGTEGDAKGDAKNDNNGSFVPSVPPVPPENKRENFGDRNSKDITQKDSLINTWDKGDIGDGIVRDRDIDVDFDDKKIGKSVPFSVPPGRSKGDTPSSECENKSIPQGSAMSKIEEQTKAPQQAGKDHPSEQIRVAAYMEYGINGEVDPVNLAAKLGIPMATAAAWLEANYLRLDKPGGLVRYTQRRAGSEARA